MSEDPITHKSTPKELASFDMILDTTDKNGIKCEWRGNYDYYPNLSDYEIILSWSFDWSEMKESGVDGLSGHITVTSSEDNFDSQTIDVNLTENPQVIRKTIRNLPFHDGYAVMFEYELIPHHLQIQEEALYDEMFLPSELNDTVLVIDEKRLHVNKAFLSIHSEFFRALFSSKFKEGQMEKIPIKDVSYADFGLLMSTIYPNTVFPIDNTVEKLLELANRFLMPSVIRAVEFHLLHDTNINSAKVMWIAKKYGMTKLLKKRINGMNTIEKAKKLHTSPEYDKLSKDTKAAILDRLMKTF